MYLDFPLFLAGALLLSPTLLAMSSGALARRGGSAAAAAAAVAVLAAAYSAASPLGWQLALGEGAGRAALLRALALLRRHGTLHLPLLLHAQALLCLCASALLAPPPPPPPPPLSPL